MYTVSFLRSPEGLKEPGAQIEEYLTEQMAEEYLAQEMAEYLAEEMT